MTKRTVEDVLSSTWDVLFPGVDEEVVVTLAARSGEGDTPLHVMTWRKDVEGASILIDAGADVNALGDMDQTPLHVAIMQDDLAMVELLLKSGARIDLRSEFGKTAAEEAEDKGQPVVALLRRHVLT